MVLTLPWREHTCPIPWKLAHLTAAYIANFQLRPIPLILWQQQYGKLIINNHPPVAQNTQHQQREEHKI